MKNLFLDIKFYTPFVLKTLGEAMEYLGWIIGIFVYMVVLTVVLTLAGFPGGFAASFPFLSVILIFFWVFRDRRRR